MRKNIFIYGGVRSGKSSYAVNYATSYGKKVTLLATTIYPDDEMKDRIEKHQKSRPADWNIIEEGINVQTVIGSINDPDHIVLLDCLGVWISNLLLTDFDDNKIEEEINKLVETIEKINYTLLIVSNEVGSGVVPPYLLGRRFRDLLGLANQRIAKTADEVILMNVGIPMKIK
jgi:adenosylcobinamide kinase / adenosylcobinamide-phosphate guanylyltransferase